MIVNWLFTQSFVKTLEGNDATGVRQWQGRRSHIASDNITEGLLGVTEDVGSE